MNSFSDKRLCRSIICLAFAAIAAAFIPSKVQAVPLPGFTGYSGSSSSVIVNYAVLPPFDSFNSLLAAAYVPGPSNSGFDTSKYTYLYQVVTPISAQRYPGSLEPEATHSRSIPASTIGAFVSGNTRLDFLNGGSIVNAIGNNLQGPDSFGIAARTVSGPAQIQVSTNPPFSGSQTHPYWGFGQIAPGLSSPLLGYQSAFGPSFSTGALNGSTQPSGFPFVTDFLSLPNAVSASAPEPSTLLMIGSGLLGVVAWRRKHRPLTPAQ